MKKIKAVLGVFLSLLLCLSVSYAGPTTEDAQVDACSCVLSDSLSCSNLSLSKASCKQERDSTNKTYCYDYSAPVIDPKTTLKVCLSNWVKQVCEAIVIKSCGNPGSDACEKQLKKCIKSMSSNQSTDPNCQCKRPQQVTQW